MRPATVLGALLILVGVILLSAGGLSFKTPPHWPQLSCLAVGGGVVLVVARSPKAR